jgi:SAM-dependent methyltransferase
MRGSSAVTERGHRDVLDVGCGDGFLLQQLAPLVETATGIEPDPGARERARVRLAGVGNATVQAGGFDVYDPKGARFDLITFVASLHHMHLRESLAKARRLLRPGGELLVVGLAADRSIADRAFAAMGLPWARIGSLLHGETGDIGVPVAEPNESLSEIRHAVRTVLPGARIRRGLYYRYLLRWMRPES